MKVYTEKVVQEIASYVCDKCQCHEDAESMAGQEFMHIDTVGGYSSIFGDGMHIELDLCQHCVKTALGPWLRLT